MKHKQEWKVSGKQCEREDWDPLSETKAREIQGQSATGVFCRFPFLLLLRAQPQPPTRAIIPRHISRGASGAQTSSYNELSPWFYSQIDSPSQLAQCSSSLGHSSQPLPICHIPKPPQQLWYLLPCCLSPHGHFCSLSKVMSSRKVANSIAQVSACFLLDEH